jgi:hypothetical protein
MSGEDWREKPLSEMFEEVIRAVDCAKGECEEDGDKDFIRLCDEVIFPFLLEEFEMACLAEEWQERQ